MYKLSALVLATVLAAGCGDSFSKVQEVDTVDAYEEFVKNNPSSPFVTQATIRIEELMLEKAQEERTLEAYDAVIERFPEGKGQLYSKIWDERRDVLFDWADETDTPEAWQRYLDEYPTGDKKKKIEARTRIKLAEFLPDLVVGPPEMEQINLARDPDGPLNGWEFRSDVTWNGDREVQYLNMRIYYQDADGKTLDKDEWPAVAKHLPGYLPFKEGFDAPIKKGETRTFWYTTGDLPAGWAKKIKIKPIKIKFADEYKDDEEDE